MKHPRILVHSPLGGNQEAIDAEARGRDGAFSKNTQGGASLSPTRASKVLRKTIVRWRAHAMRTRPRCVAVIVGLTLQSLAFVHAVPQGWAQAGQPASELKRPAYQPVEDTDAYLLSRFRLSADLHVTPYFRMFVEGKSSFSLDRNLVGGRTT